MGVFPVFACMPRENRSSTVSTEQPINGAERNQPLASHSEQGAQDMLLPTLDDGITLLDFDGGRGVPLLQSLVLDHLLLAEGPAFWVDAQGHATTTTLARLSPSPRLLDRIHVDRGFTTYQHYGAIAGLRRAVNQSIRDDTSGKTVWTLGSEETESSLPSLIVVPAIDALYRTADSLSASEAKTLQARAIARIAAYAEGYDVPVLVTRTESDEFTRPVEAAADNHLICEQTAFGPRFIGDEFETMVYPVGNGSYYQTTFAYWQQFLATRAVEVGTELTPASPSTGESDIGTGVTISGSETTATASPLMDAWVSVGGGR